ncbi:MAG TPA: hypothetical protein PKY31_06625 [Spirochaetota bacterium]|nr:hypothetical protein [Spirochaetota bacterium]
MKKICIAAVIMFALGGALPGQQGGDNESIKRELGRMEGNVYINDTLGIKLTFPKDFEYKANPLSGSHVSLFENYYKNAPGGPSQFSFCVIGNTKSNPKKAEYVMFHVEKAWDRMLYKGKLSRESAMFYSTAMLKTFGENIFGRKVDWLPSDTRVIKGIRYWMGLLEAKGTDPSGKTMTRHVIHYVAVVDKYFIGIQEFYMLKDGERVKDFTNYPGYTSLQVLNTLERTR